VSLTTSSTDTAALSLLALGGGCSEDDETKNKIKWFHFN
jgi:hypothetical protein